jgi:hypothetical protein
MSDQDSYYCCRTHHLPFYTVANTFHARLLSVILWPLLYRLMQKARRLIVKDKARRGELIFVLQLAPNAKLIGSIHLIQQATRIYHLRSTLVERSDTKQSHPCLQFIGKHCHD